MNQGSRPIDTGRIGLGAFKIGRRDDKYGDYEVPSEQEAVRFVRSVLDMGVRTIDTARSYGDSEDRVGKAIRGRRHEVVLCSKVGEGAVEDGLEYSFSKADMVASVSESLRRLGTDYLDILLLHASRDDVRVLRETDAVETMVRMKEQGVASRIGVSGYSKEFFRESLSWCDYLMVEYNVDDDGMSDVMSEARSAGKGVLVKRGMGRGAMPPEEAVRFVMSNPDVDCLIIGSKSTENMKRNLEWIQ